VPLRNFSVRIPGAAAQIEELRRPLRDLTGGAGARFVTVRPDGDDVLVNAVFDVRSDRRLVARLLRDARRTGLHDGLAVERAADRPHELSAQLADDLRRGRTVLPHAVQAREDLEAWNEFLRDAEPCAVLELGTASGSFANWLHERVDWLRTIDIQPPAAHTPGFLQLDVWAQHDVVRDLIAKAPRPFVLYCDDGDKKREVETFAPSLRAGDFLAVHDLGTEIFAANIPPGFVERVAGGLTGFYELRAAGVEPGRAHGLA
jgi:hypothetical protein